MMSKLALLWRALMASLVLAMLWLAAPAMADELRLGYVDTERVYREATAAVKAQQRLKAEFAPREAELADMARHARELKQTLDAGKLSDAERRTRERELQALDRDFQAKQLEFRQEFGQRRTEEFAAIQQRANQVIRDLARSERFDLILQDVVYVSPRFDLTERVLKALDD